MPWIKQAAELKPGQKPDNYNRDQGYECSTPWTKLVLNRSKRQRIIEFADNDFLTKQDRQVVRSISNKAYIIQKKIDEWRA